MIRATISGFEALDAIADRLRRLQELDLAPLAERIAAIVGDDIRDRLGAEQTASGASFAPLAESTVKQRHGSTRIGGSLPANVQVDIDVQPDRVEVTAGWSGNRATHARLFSGGTGRMPGRDLTGISARAEAQVRAAVEDFFRSAWGNA
jgi:hypothetical protein